MPESRTAARFAGLTLRDWIKKAVVFLVVTVVMGWFYAWASPRVFPKETRLGFGHGLLHGALMPMALPSLVMGMEVDIFAANNSGQPYKIGYICGINLCGLIFFGSAFWKPRKKNAASQTDV
jgi:hypothetical protein